eukprot:scaffold1640_cov101-Cylindrotheca_fusiformis.AAC.3
MRYKKRYENSNNGMTSAVKSSSFVEELRTPSSIAQEFLCRRKMGVRVVDYSDLVKQKILHSQTWHEERDFVSKSTIRGLETKYTSKG